MKVDTQFVEDIHLGEDFNAQMCINCGTCTALCPLGVELLPRRLFRYVLLGNKEKVIENTESIYSCLLCRMCESNCPGGVHITENVRALRSYLNDEVFHIAEAGVR